VRTVDLSADGRRFAAIFGSMVAWLAAKQYATVELHIVSPPPGGYLVFSTVGRSVVFGLGTGLECSVSASDSVSRHSKGDTYAGCVDAAPNESLLVYDRRDTQKDRRVDGRTDGRTPNRCFTLFAIASVLDDAAAS